MERTWCFVIVVTDRRHQLDLSQPKHPSALHFNLFLLISPEFSDILTLTRMMIAPKVLKDLLNHYENAYLLQKKEKHNFSWLSLGPSRKLMKKAYI